MTLILDLTAEELGRIYAAQEKGIDVMAIMKGVIAGLPEWQDVQMRNGEVREAADQDRDQELVARVKSLRGKYAHTAIDSGTEELHRERQRDKEKEEAAIRVRQL